MLLSDVRMIRHTSVKLERRQLYPIHHAIGAVWSCSWPAVYFDRHKPSGPQSVVASSLFSAVYFRHRSIRCEVRSFFFTTGTYRSPDMYAASSAIVILASLRAVLASAAEISEL